MNRLALHVAEAVERRSPQPALPPEVRDDFAEMGRLGVALATKAADVVRSRNVVRAVELDRDDDEMDGLHRRMFEVLMAEDWPHGVASRRRRDAAGALVRALRRPRRRGGARDRLRRHRVGAGRDPDLSGAAGRSGSARHRAERQRGGHGRHRRQQAEHLRVAAQPLGAAAPRPRARGR
jgi:hypothetical protein